MVPAVRYGDIVALTKAVGTKQVKRYRFLPVNSKTATKMYAAGKIPEAIKRRPSMLRTYSALQSTVRSGPMLRGRLPVSTNHKYSDVGVDPNCPPEMAAMFGSSLALWYF